MILNIKKPRGITSHDVVDEVRRITGERRVGHAGTLDPFASGVLVVAVGREDTRKLGELTKNTEKEYVATLELGKTSITGDPEGTITPEATLDSLSFPRLRQVKEALEGFRGEIEQAPPAYSAVKVSGIPAYKLARRGAKMELPKRKVKIHGVELLEYNPPFLKIRVACSAGTYIRSLAQDIGAKLGLGAYVTELVRTRVGSFSLKDAIALERLPSFLENKKSLPGG